MFNFKFLVMSRYILFFFPLMMLSFMGCNKKSDANKPVALGDHSTKPVLLQGTYNETTDHKKEKKFIKKKIKKLDTVINTQFDHLKDWVSNVGEAIEMME
jgi:hypothetical protein